MNSYRTHEIVLFVLTLILFSFGPLGELFLDDPDVGWLFSIIGVTLIVLQFTVVKEIRNNLRFVSEYLKLRNTEIRWVVDRKIRELTKLVDEASKETLSLGLDDLFETVSHLVSKCETLEAVDIRFERWGSDIRAIKYLEACRKASSRGAKIERIMVIEEEVMEGLLSFQSSKVHNDVSQMMRSILEKQKEVGVSGIFVVSKDNVPPTYIRDFGIFDGNAVLDEHFDANGDSLFEGFFSTDSDVVLEYSEIFSTLRRESAKNSALVDEILS